MGTEAKENHTLNAFSVIENLIRQANNVKVLGQPSRKQNRRKGNEEQEKGIVRHFADGLSCSCL